MQPLFDVLPLDMDLFPLRATVERQVTVGRDQSGMPVATWQTVYTDLPCMTDAHVRGERMGAPRAAPGIFEQKTIEYGYLVYFPPLPAGGVPDVRVQDRLTVGTWPDGTPRYIDVTTAIDELDAGVILQVTGVARKPG